MAQLTMREMAEQGLVKCPKCGSTNVSVLNGNLESRSAGGRCTECLDCHLCAGTEQFWPAGTFHDRSTTTLSR
jgi:hypothetical protein